VSNGILFLRALIIQTECLISDLLGVLVTNLKINLMRGRNSRSLLTDCDGIMTVRRPVLFAVLVGITAASLSLGFVAGWAGSRKLGIYPLLHPNRSYFTDKATHLEMFGARSRALRTFQASYNLRDPNQLKKFIRRPFFSRQREHLNSWH
jgi:hypothetical protein